MSIELILSEVITLLNLDNNNITTYDNINKVNIYLDNHISYLNNLELHLLLSDNNLVINILSDNKIIKQPLTDLVFKAIYRKDALLSKQAMKYIGTPDFFNIKLIQNSIL